MNKKFKTLLATGALVVGVGLIASAAPNMNDLITVSGTLERYGETFYVNHVKIELGGDHWQKESDYDRNGSVQAIGAEMAGLVGKKVKIKGYTNDESTDHYKVYVTEINNMTYTNPEVRNPIVQPRSGGY